MNPATEQQEFATRGRLFLRWTGRLFLILGVLGVSYVALTLINAKVHQQAAGDELEAQTSAEEQHQAAAPRPAAKEGDVLGRLVVPRIGLSVVVLQGTTSQTLLLGAGHIAGTALPGEPGNIVIAGHRDTYFRVLRDIRRNDEIEIRTAAGLSQYEVDWIQIVNPGDTEVLNNSRASELTLVTCYPFHYIGSAPERYIVHAHAL
jgi:sortase A